MGPDQSTARYNSAENIYVPAFDSSGKVEIYKFIYFLDNICVFLKNGIHCVIYNDLNIYNIVLKSYK